MSKQKQIPSEMAVDVLLSEEISTREPITRCERCHKHFSLMAVTSFTYAQATVVLCFVCCELVTRVLAHEALHERVQHFAIMRERWKEQKEKSA